ncbi:MAG: hypothetical protein ACM3JB_11125 [Acidobacteriaceae bacterium]|jgi:hypothetical protein
MQFEVNGQKYFLQYSSEDNQWVFFRPSGDGIEFFDIADDTAQSDGSRVMIPFGNDDRGTVN